MILVDASVWIDHIRTPRDDLAALLLANEVLAHPFVTGKIALGRIASRSAVLDALEFLPRTAVASDKEVLALIEHRSLFGRGIGYVDAHLLAATLISAPARLWTRDRRLLEAARDLRIAHDP